MKISVADMILKIMKTDIRYDDVLGRIEKREIFTTRQYDNQEEVIDIFKITEWKEFDSKIIK